MKVEKSEIAVLRKCRSMSYPTFLEHLRARYGHNWVIARRTSRIVARYGEDVHCFSPSAYAREQEEWRDEHPAVKLVLTLPDGAERDLILDATKRVLS